MAKVTVYISKEVDILSISKKKLANLYLKKSERIGTQKIVIIDNIKDHEEFCRKILNKTPSQVHAYWMKQVFLGKNVPPKRYTQDGIADVIRNSKNTIGYSSKTIHARVIFETN
jgi:hypothetical protein